MYVPLRKGTNNTFLAKYFINLPIQFVNYPSLVMGPMGPELVPLASREEAESFRADHGGDRVLAFDEVTREVVPP